MSVCLCHVQSPRVDTSTLLSPFRSIMYYRLSLFSFACLLPLPIFLVVRMHTLVKAACAKNARPSEFVFLLFSLLLFASLKFTCVRVFLFLVPFLTCPLLRKREIYTPRSILSSFDCYFFFALPPDMFFKKAENVKRTLTREADFYVK